MSLDQILNTEHLAQDAARLISESSGCHIAISGPDGRGKSELIHRIVKQPLLDDYCCILLNGNSTYKDQSFFPLQQFVEKKDKDFNRGIRALKESIALIPYVGKTVKAFLEDYDFKKHKNREVIQEMAPFKAHLDFSVHIIGLLRKYEEVVIFCDDVQDFDEATISYLSLLQDGIFQLGIDKKISFVTSSNGIGVLSNWSAGAYHSIVLPPFTDDEIKKIIFIQSAKHLTDDEIRFIYSATGGHLQLLKIAAEYVSEASFNLRSGQNNFIERLVKLRMKEFEDLTALLTALGRGKISSIYELYCLLDNSDNLKQMIRKGVNADILKQENQYLRFAHPLIAGYASELPLPKTVFFEKLASCLQKLTPAEYQRRAMILNLAEKHEEAEIVTALAAISAFRAGAFIEGNRIISALQTSSLGTDLAEALAIFATCFEINATGKIDETLLELERIPNTLPREVLAEKVYLKADTLARRISDDAKRDALLLIAEWEDIKNDEPEIWYRLVQTKLIVAAELGLYDLSLHAEAEIIKYYSARLSFDPHSKPLLDRLNIFSEVMYSPEIANRKMTTTEKRLTDQLLQDNYHRIFDLYLSRTNLSSNCLIVDDLPRAIEYAQGAIMITDQFPDLKFPCPEASFNNLYLAALFREEDPELIYAKFQDLYQSAAIEENKLLIDINYAGLCIVTSRNDEALAILENCIYKPEINTDNAFYSYYYFVDYAIALFLNNRQVEAAAIIDSLSEVHAKVSPMLRRYYEQHYLLVKQVILTQSFLSYQEITAYAQATKPVFLGKTWKRFISLYLFTDIQIWNLF